VISLVRFRTAATVVAVVGLLVVVVIGVLGAVLRSSGVSSAPKAASPAPVASAGTPRVEAAALTASTVPAGWQRVRSPDGSSYAVPSGWKARPVDERVAYRDQGQVAVEGRVLVQSWANDCRSDFVSVPVAWALLGAPVRSGNPDGVARAAAAAWARGYAAMEASAVPAPTVRSIQLATGERGVAATVELDLRGSANPCAGERADLTVVAVAEGEQVRSLVFARYLGVRGSPSDAAYRAVLGSFEP